jgi:hypothetical protein
VVKEKLTQFKAEEVWIIQGKGHYFFEFYLGEGKGCLSVKVPKEAARQFKFLKCETTSIPWPTRYSRKS